MEKPRDRAHEECPGLQASGLRLLPRDSRFGDSGERRIRGKRDGEGGAAPHLALHGHPCPDQAGSLRDGCPVVDTDGDGISDRYDKCPTVAEPRDGRADGDGCPISS